MSRTKSIFILSHDQKTTRLIRAFDGAMSSHYSRLQVGTIQGRVRTIPALVHPDATDQDMWRVVNLAAPHGTCFDSVAVLGALDDNQAAQWAVEEFGQYANAHVVQPVSCGNAKGVQYVLDHAVTHEPRMIRADGLRLASDRVVSEAVLWDSMTLVSHLGTSSGLMRDLISHDWDGELLDAMTLTDLAKLATDDAEVLNFDALIVQYNKLDTLINRLTAAMAKSTVGDLKVTNVTQSKPFKKNGVAQVAVLFELSDGQTMTILLHNPDSTPAKIAPTDNLTSWKWLLNKRDVSVVVQPKQGEDVQMPVLAARMLKIATQNSARFKRTQGKRLEVEQTITDTQTRIQEKQGQLQALNNEIQALQGQIDEGLKAKPASAESGGFISDDDPANQDDSTVEVSQPQQDDQEAQAVNLATQQPVISPEEASLNKELERQAFMKSVNKIVKSKKSDEEKIRLLMENFKIKEGMARELLKPDFAGRIGFPDYELTSVNNKIKRLREKVDFARKHEELAANGMDDMTISGVDIKMDKEENRLRLYFPKKPSGSVISELRSNGFVWSPTNQAWQRQLNENSLNAAKRVISLYADETGESDDTKDAFEVPNNSEPEPMPETKPVLTRDQEYLKSIVDGTDSPLADESRFWNVLNRVEPYDKPLVDEAYAVAMRIYDKFEEQSKSVKSESNPDRDYLQSVIDGKEDLSDADAVEKRLEEISERLDTPELEAMFEKAADAFAAYAVSLEV